TGVPSGPPVASQSVGRMKAPQPTAEPRAMAKTQRGLSVLAILSGAPPSPGPVGAEATFWAGFSSDFDMAPYFRHFAVKVWAVSFVDCEALASGVSACRQVMSPTLTMSETLAPRDRSLIGAARPCSRGPNASAPPRRSAIL